MIDVTVLGAGPAGLSLATMLAETGVAVRIIDEAPAPGGQVFRGTERNAGRPHLTDWLGKDYAKGRDLIMRARAATDITWHMGTSVWDIRPEDGHCDLGVLCDGKTEVIRSRIVVLATGAMERPTPFPGWTLPGVLSIGAAQTLLKDGGLLPEDGAVLAGQGPLLYLFAAQILDAGVTPGLVLDLSRKWAAPGHLPALARAALNAPGMIAKGLRLRNRIAAAGVPHLYGVDGIKAQGSDRVERVSYRHKGAWHEVRTSLLLVHDGVIPNTHISKAAGCAHSWSDTRAAWEPKLDAEGQSDRNALWILGDAARIMGADAAITSGRVMARAIAHALGLPPPDDVLKARADRQTLARLVRLRDFLDRQYPPARAFTDPADDTTICRCEAITAGEIRALAASGCMGPNQLRAFCRAGMGPCMGRQCGTAISGIMAKATGQSIGKTGSFTVRMPLKPVTIGDLANLGAPSEQLD